MVILLPVAKPIRVALVAPKVIAPLAVPLPTLSIKAYTVGLLALTKVRLLATILPLRSKVTVPALISTTAAVPKA